MAAEVTDMRCPPLCIATRTAHLPLKGGGRRAKHAGWGSIAEPETPSPTLPLSGGGSKRLCPPDQTRTSLPLPKQPGRPPHQQAHHHQVNQERAELRHVILAGDVADAEQG